MKFTVPNVMFICTVMFDCIILFSKILCPGKSLQQLLNKSQITFLTLVTVEKAKLLLTLSTALFYSSVPVSHDSVNWTPKNEAAK